MIQKLYLKLLSNNLIKKRNFFINLLILSSLSLVFIKNLEKIRYTDVKASNGKTYVLDRFKSTIKMDQ